MSQRLLVELGVRSDKGDYPIRAHCCLNQGTQSSNVKGATCAHPIFFGGLTAEQEFSVGILRNALPHRSVVRLGRAEDAFALKKALADSMSLLNRFLDKG